MKNMTKKLFIISLVAIAMPAFADDIVPAINNDLGAAAQKLNDAKGLYNLTTNQERSMKDLRKAAKMSLKAAEMRAKAEKLQARADALIQRAKQNAISTGIHFDVGDGPLKMDAPVDAATQQTANANSGALPGQPINILLPQAISPQTAQNYGAPVPTSY